MVQELRTKVRDVVANWCAKFPIIGPTLGRVWHEIVFFLLNAMLLFYSKDFIQTPGLQLLLYKMLLINAGVIHATITRKIIFPYIDFHTEPDSWKKGLVVAFYVIIIYSYSHGG